ncbi:threonine/serine exporter family protein, partial [Cobetia sp. SIMBA_158]|uniref:threonine/serine exporter family protein n=1 Tax=Cobetia sp. SIMBA_158 TaxID=3081617 RepID=UPI00397EE09A
DHDLGSLADTDDLVNKMLNEELSLHEVDQQLDIIFDAPNPYNKLTTGIAFATSGGAFAMLMGTSWTDVIWSALLTLVVYMFVLWSMRSKRV